MHDKNWNYFYYTPAKALLHITIFGIALRRYEMDDGLLLSARGIVENVETKMLEKAKVVVYI